jgi:hypothetical protein
MAADQGFHRCGGRGPSVRSPPMTETTSDTRAGTAVPLTPARPSWGEILRRLLMSAVTSLAAAVVAQLLGAQTLPAIVLGAAFPQLLEQVAERYRWPTHRIAPVAALLALVYGRDWLRDRLSGGTRVVSPAHAVAITAAAALGVVGAMAVANGPEPASLSGTWQTTAFKVESRNGLTSAAPAPRQRWKIAPAPGCGDSRCGYQVAVDAADRFTFRLEAAANGTFTGNRPGRADCVADTRPHDVVVAGGYADHWRYRVVPMPSTARDPDHADVLLQRVASATPEARAKNCRARVTATYRADAVRIG